MRKSILLVDFPCNFISILSKKHNVPKYKLESGILFRISDIFLLPISDKVNIKDGTFIDYKIHKENYNRNECILFGFESYIGRMFNNPKIDTFLNNKKQTILLEIDFFYYNNSIGIILQHE